MRPVSSCLTLIVASAALLTGISHAPALGGGGSRGASGAGAVGGRGAIPAGFAPASSPGVGVAGFENGFAGGTAGSTLAFGRYGTGGSVGVPLGHGDAGPGQPGGYGGGRGGGFGYGGYGGYGLPYGAFGGYPGDQASPRIVHHARPTLPEASGMRDTPVLPPAIYVIGGSGTGRARRGAERRPGPTSSGIAPRGHAGVGMGAGNGAVASAPKIIRLDAARS